MIIAPFSKRIDTITGPTSDLATIGQAIGAIRPAGGTAILDSLIEAARSLQSAEDVALSSS